MSSHLRTLALGAALFLTHCACDAPTEDPSPSPAPGPCESTTLENTIDAAPAVAAATGVASYRYSAPLDEVELAVTLLDDGGTTLGLMQVAQVFDGSLVDGTMRAALGDVVLSERALLLASGERVLRSTLSFDEGPRLLIEATFEDHRCREVSPAALACAPGVELDPTDALIVPSCGLDFDRELARGALPTLTRLRYRVLVAEAAGAPAVGGLDETGEEPAYAFDAVLDAEMSELADRRAFLEDTGVYPSLLGDDARRLFAAYADPTWSRLLQQHAAHCLTSGAFDDELGLVSQSAARALTGGSNANRDTSSYAGSSSRTGASSRGDPHLTTFDLRDYDLQARGEFVLARSTPGATRDLEVQARFEPLAFVREHPLCQSVSFTTAVAVRAGEHVLEVHPGASPVLDGAPLALGTSALGGPDEPRLSSTRSEVRLVWPDDTELEISTTGRYLAVRMYPGDDLRGRVEGLFGDADGDPGNDLILADGARVAIPAAFDVLHGPLREAWQVDEETSLFSYDDGGGPADFVDVAFPTVPADPALLPPPERASLESDCRARGADGVDLVDCVIDLFCTADLALADDARGSPPLAWQERPSGVALSGAVIEVGHDDELDTDERVSATSCARFQEGAALLLPEAQDTLAQDLALDDVTLPAGTTLRAYTLFLPASDEERPLPLSGQVRFGRPVRALIDDAAGLIATDGFLPEGASVIGSGRGLDGPGSVVALDADNLGLRFTLEQGADPESIRVLVEEVSP